MSSIDVENVTLDYIVGRKLNSLKSLLNPKMDPNLREKLKGKVFRGLDQLNLHLKDGDRLGLIGPNGAGKSSLLRVLSGIYRPTYGRVIVKGKVSTLLQQSVGLNMEATGYENIILLGVMNGQNKKDMRKRMKDIEEFSELGIHLYDPVRTYSNGMLAKLIFTTLTSISHDILLMDEGIGTGDQRFIERAKNRMNDMLTAANIVVVASHSDILIRNICNKVLVMNQGKIIFIGEPEAGYEIYYRDILKIDPPSESKVVEKKQSLPKKSRKSQPDLELLST